MAKTRRGPHRKGRRLPEWPPFAHRRAHVAAAEAKAGRRPLLDREGKGVLNDHDARADTPVPTWQLVAARLRNQRRELSENPPPQLSSGFDLP
jgi:hypothetical protein